RIETSGTVTEVRFTATALGADTMQSLGKLVTLHKELRAVGGELILYNVTPEVHEVFAVARLTEFDWPRKKTCHLARPVAKLPRLTESVRECPPPSLLLGKESSYARPVTSSSPA